MSYTRDTRDVGQIDRIGTVWKGADPVHDIVCEAGVAASVAAAAFDNSRRVSRGGLEIGGILLGHRSDAGLAVQRWVPIPCEHARGPAFVLSERDERALAVALAESSRPGLEIVGWFVSHSRSGPTLTDSDLDVFRRFFKEWWQVTVVLKPAMDGSARGRVYSHHPDGVAFGPEFRLALSSNAPPEASFSRVPTSDEPQSAVRVRRVDPEARGVIEPPQFLTSRPVAGSTRWIIVPVTMAFLLIAAALFGGSVRQLLPRQTPSLGLRASDSSGQLRIEWDRAAVATVGEAQRATVDVSDGGQVKRVLLNAEHLRHGSFTYVRQSDDVEFAFTLHPDDQRSITELTRFIGPLHSRESRTADNEAYRDQSDSPERARVRELERENQQLKSALQKEAARRVQQDEAIRILRQHMRR